MSSAQHQCTDVYILTPISPQMAQNDGGLKLALECHITTSYQRNYTIIHTRAYKTNTHTTINEENTRPTTHTQDCFHWNTYMHFHGNRGSAQTHVSYIKMV